MPTDVSINAKCEKKKTKEVVEKVEGEKLFIHMKTGGAIFLHYYQLIT